MNTQTKGEGKNMEKEFSTEYIKFNFTEEEKRDIAAEMARKVTDLAQAENDKKAIMSDLKSKIDSLTAQVNVAATKLNNGYEYRNVKCEIDPVYAEKKVLFWFDGRIVKERPMTNDEMQIELELKGA